MQRRSEHSKDKKRSKIKRQVCKELLSPNKDKQLKGLKRTKNWNPLPHRSKCLSGQEAQGKMLNVIRHPGKEL